jgi:Putative glucoamylase
VGAGQLAPEPPAHRRGQIHHGLREAQYGYWGFSPANIPEGGYAAYGVDAIGMDPNGYPSNNDATLVDHGFEGCPGREPQPDPPPSAYTNGVVTPHAAFLALRWAPRRTLANLARLEADFDVYGEWGFRDSVNVDTGVVSSFYLSLDQGMIMAAIGNALADDVSAARSPPEPPSAPCGRWSGWRSSPPSRAAARSPAARAPTGCGERLVRT